MSKSSQKFLPRSLTLLVPILEMIKEGGIICSDIAKNLNISKQRVSYYVIKAKKQGLVKEIWRDTFKEFQITQAGQNFLVWSENSRFSLTATSTSTIVPICRLENVRFKAVITRMPIVAVDWAKIQMHNWVLYSAQIDGVKVRLNAGANPTLELLPSPVEGADPYDLFVKQVFECYCVLLDLYDKIGLKAGQLQLNSRPEWLVYEPLAKSFCKHNGQVTYPGIGKVNASPPNHYGEFEFHDPRSLHDYLLMPQRLKTIEHQLAEVLQRLGLPPTAREEVADG